MIVHEGGLCMGAVVRWMSAVGQSCHTCAVTAPWPKLGFMANLYDSLVAALRAHWTAHGNTYPQHIELTAGDLQALNEERKLINDTMNFRQMPGWEQVFHGAQLQVGEVNCLVLASGERLPVSLVDVNVKDGEGA